MAHGDNDSNETEISEFLRLRGQKHSLSKKAPPFARVTVFLRFDLMQPFHTHPKFPYRPFDK